MNEYNYAARTGVLHKVELDPAYEWFHPTEFLNHDTTNCGHSMSGQRLPVDEFPEDCALCRRCFPKGKP